MKVHSLPDITIASTGVPQAVLAVGHQRCKWYQIQGLAVSAVARMGDSDVSLTRGLFFIQGGAQFSPEIAEDALNSYDLADVFAVGTAGDVLAVNYAQ